MNDKFRLELKAGTPEQCREWISILEAKRQLHNLDKLTHVAPSEFRTSTFKSLLQLSEVEQDRWMNNSINDTFENFQREGKSLGLRDDALFTVLAARACLEEFITVCEECTLEYSCRSPAVIANCRHYIHRYAECFKGRVILELACYLNVDFHKQVGALHRSTDQY